VSLRKSLPEEKFAFHWFPWFGSSVSRRPIWRISWYPCNRYYCNLHTLSGKLVPF